MQAGNYLLISRWIRLICATEWSVNAQALTFATALNQELAHGCALRRLDTSARLFVDLPLVAP